MLTRSRYVTLLWMVVIVIAMFGLYQVKYKVQALQVEVAETERKLTEAREALHVVSAEWAYLNRPERLQYLSKKYLSLVSVDQRKIGQVAAIPFSSQTLAKRDESRTLVNASLEAGKQP